MTTEHLNSLPSTKETTSDLRPPTQLDKVLAEEDITPTGFIPLANSSDYSVKRAEYGTWRIVCASGSGAVPTMLADLYTDITAAEFDVDNYINLQNLAANKNNKG